MSQKLRCKLFHVRSGVALIALDERGRRWCVYDWECSCGHKYSSGFRVEDDERRFYDIGASIHRSILGELS